jgi:hypothetical protein
LHLAQEHPDLPIRDHVRELIGQLDALGIKPSSDGDDGEVWEGFGDEDSDDDEDVEMQS